jgi:hypothetical protein
MLRSTCQVNSSPNPYTSHLQLLASKNSSISSSNQMKTPNQLSRRIRKSLPRSINCHQPSLKSIRSLLILCRRLSHPHPQRSPATDPIWNNLKLRFDKLLNKLCRKLTCRLRNPIPISTPSMLAIPSLQSRRTLKSVSQPSLTYLVVEKKA